MATRLPSAADTCPRSAEDQAAPARRRPRTRCLARRRRSRRVDRARRSCRRPTTEPASRAASSPCSRESSMICCTSRASRSLSVCIRAANRCDGLGVVGGVDDRLGEQLDRADRGLQLVADVGDEVAADRLDAALAGAVLDQRQHEPASPSGATRAVTLARRARRVALEHQLGLADLAVAAYLRGRGRPARGPRPALPRTRPIASAGAWPSAPRRRRRRPALTTAGPRARRRRRAAARARRAPARRRAVPAR